jgi:DNA-directed RNA polymerase I, II, and III subunit RPABC2
VPEGEQGEEQGEDVNGEVSHPNGINGVDHDQEMANGEDQTHQQQAASSLQPERQPNKVRVTTPYLTKYERARILGTRALQIR